jgi:hypothetical protein
MLNICQHKHFAKDSTCYHTFKHRYVYWLRRTIKYHLGRPKYTNLGNAFRFMKLEESMVGEDSKSEETCSELVGTHFTIEKIKFR